MEFNEKTFYHTGRYSYEDGYSGMQDGPDANTPQVTAIFAMADVIAIGAIRAAMADAGSCACRRISRSSATMD